MSPRFIIELLVTMQRGKSSVNLDASWERAVRANIVNRIHKMTWLKQTSSMQKQNTRRLANDQRVISLKKTDEDYFCGTRKEKKKRKRKEETEQSMEGSKLQQNFLEKKRTEIIKIPSNSAADVFVDESVWSSDTNVANKLFANVQSVRIDTLTEEEMLSQALAESIATAQLEQFKRLSPKKENRWDALYGDHDDDDAGWDNVQRNMPSPIEKAINNISCQRKSFNNNNNKNKNNNTCPKSGILRNCKVNSCTNRSENLDFCFKKRSSMPDEEIKEIRSPRVVAFNESIDVKIASSDSGEDCERSEYHPKKSVATFRINDSEPPNIDKYGRLDRYSERRLFMGKGARMKEQQYIQNTCSLGVGNVRSRDSVPNNTSSAKVMQTDNVGKSKSGEENIIDVRSVGTSDQTLKKPLFVKDTKSSIVEESNHSILESASNNSSADRLSDQSSCAIDSSTESINNCSAPPKSGAETSKRTESKIYGLKEVNGTDKICDRNFNAINKVSKSTEPENIHRVQFISSSTQTSVSEVSENGTESNVPRKKSTYMQDLQEERKDQKLESKICYSADNVTESTLQGNKSDSEANYGVWVMMRENPCMANIPATSLQYTDSVFVIENQKSPSPVPSQNSHPRCITGMESNLDRQNSLALNINFDDTQNQDLLALYNQFALHENGLIHQLTNYNAYPLPDHSNVEKEMQCQQGDCAHSVNPSGTQYLPYQNVCPMINSPYGPFDYVQDDKNVFSSTPIDNESLFMNNKILPPFDPQIYQEKIRSEKSTHRWIKNDKLPPGFAKHRAIRKNDDENNQLIINSLAVNMSENNREEVQKPKSIRPRNENYCAENLPSQYTQNNPDYYDTRAHSFSPCAKQQTHKLPTRFQNQGAAKRPTSLPIPHPILGASLHRQEPQGKISDVDIELERLKLNGYSESCWTDESISIQNLIESMIPSIYKNNYRVQDEQSPISESYHLPGFNNVINGHHKVNMTNPNHLPVNLDPSIQIMQDASPGSSDVDFPQFQSNTINSGNTTPLTSMLPPNMNANTCHNIQNLQQSNVASPTNAHRTVEMMQCQDSQEIQRPLSNHFVHAIGRGRGRFTKRESQ
ncbi:uncharacterized protein LOC124174827 isoform X1 [Neodiprion fabricii]|uniref:uncharacterized protein LOC124174827 isoform X1 n=2 Tax=Neodiprion fabricii TaxID=2872261 RepID=UPI001ED90B1B|nr:uncharacterized protein LOC124174827 isoform X1 [Neodiprion fabricii]